MARRWFTSFAASLAAMIVPLAAGGCEDDAVSLRIECSINPDVGADGCTWEAEGNCLAGAALNVLASNSYFAAFRVVSGLKARDSDNPVRAEANGINVQELEVELQNSAGDQLSFPGLPNPFRLPTSGYLEPGGSAAIGATVIPAAYGDVLRDQETDPESTPLGQIVVAVSAIGTTQGNVDVESRRLNLPVQLVAVNPEGGSCQTAPDSFCFFGQDSTAFSCVPEASE